MSHRGSAPSTVEMAGSAFANAFEPTALGPMGLTPVVQIRHPDPEMRRVAEDWSAWKRSSERDEPLRRAVHKAAAELDFEESDYSRADIATNLQAALRGQPWRRP